MASQRAATVRRWILDPSAFVREALNDVPDRWQQKALDHIKDEVAKGLEGERLHAQVRVALQACKGPGKSRFKAWVVWWFLFTRKNANVIALSITRDNLRDNLWKELNLLYQATPLLIAQFEIDTEKITHRKKPQTWWCHARSFPSDPDPQAQKTTIAGLHGPHVMVVMDEAGDIPPGVLAAAEGIFLNDVEAILLLGGNCSSTDGALYAAAIVKAHRYYVVPITGDPDDPDRSPRINIEEARALIEDLGRDHPHVMVNVLGQFPPTGSKKLLGPQEVQIAFKRHARAPEFDQEPLVAGLDPARSVDGDESALTFRQGVMVWPLHTWRVRDLMVLADQCASLFYERKPAAIFVGVAGLGYGVADRLRQLGFNVIDVEEAGEPLDPKFLNRRAEMWWNAAQAVKHHSCLPPDPALQADLVTPGYEYKANGRTTKIQLTAREDIEKLLGRSPDRGTSFALTFAAPVAPKGMHEAQQFYNAQATETYLAPWERRAG